MLTPIQRGCIFLDMTMNTAQHSAPSELVAAAIARGAKPRRMYGLPLINVYWAKSPYYLTTDGRYQIHKVQPKSGEGFYWVIDSITGERVNDYLYPAQEWTAQDRAGQLIQQRTEAKYGALASSGFRHIVRMLRTYIDSNEVAA